MKFPKRHSNHSLENESIVFFHSHLPNNWNVNTVDKDYGQDLNVEICEEGEFRGLELIVQMKSSNVSSERNDFETQVLKIATYNYLWDNLRVVMIIKYVQNENEAYWILLSDVPKPDQDNLTLTLKIPRTNVLSKIDWMKIAEYVRHVTEGKLSSWRNK